MANSIPQDTDYDEIRAVLDSTADEMAALVRSNRDSNKPRERVSAGGTVPQATTRPLSPVRESDLASVNQRAAAILEQTQTMLLRTPEDGTGKNAHYTRIADALGSNKTLLRSA
jgi:hypothetical protein